MDAVRLTQELTAVVIAVWYEIDERDGSGVSQYFTPDATLTFSARSFHGTDQIDAVYAARHARGPRVARHVTTNLHVLEATETTASAVSTLCLYAADGEPPRPLTTPSMVGRVADHFERHRDRWLIGARRIDQLFVAPDTVLAVPTS